MRRLLARLAVLAIVLLVLAWLAPTGAATFLLPRVAKALDAEISLLGVRPAWPFGITAERADVRFREHAVRFEDFSAAWDPTSYVIHARVGTGTIDARVAHTRDAAVMFLDDVPLEAFALPGRAGRLELSGRASGALRWRDGAEGVEVSLRVQDGSLIPNPEIGFALPVRYFELFGWRDGEGRTRVDALALDSPLVIARGSGEVSRRKELQLDLEVTQLEEPLRSLIGGGMIPQGPLRFRVAGTLEQPKLLLAQMPTQVPDQVPSPVPSPP
jgi:hypothetical protein